MITDSAAVDRLGNQIAELSAHLDAATAHLLDLIREFDARGGWGNGFRSCAAWLTWRVGLDPGAARERHKSRVLHVYQDEDGMVVIRGRLEPEVGAVLADAEAPGQSVLEDGARVSAETSQRLACDLSRVVMRHDNDGRVVEVGARTRAPFRRHWAHGGPTTLSNLALLCRRHRRAVHEEGYQVERQRDGELTLISRRKLLSLERHPRLVAHLVKPP